MPNCASDEFEYVCLGDKRLKSRLVKLTNHFFESPEMPINQACHNWAETKAAYRFLKNEKVNEIELIEAHSEKTVERAKQYSTIIAIQDTCYFNYTNHKKTEGLGLISVSKEKNNKRFDTNGLIMHTSFAITTEGLPLGMLDQQIIARPTLSAELKELKKRSHGNAVPIEDKESYRWIETLQNSKNRLGNSKIHMITECDREADIYDFFLRAYKLETSILVRAKSDRIINKTSRRSRGPQIHLWKHMNSQPSQGEIAIKIPSRGGKPSRTALLNLRFDKIIFSPPRNHLNYEELCNLKLNVVYVLEKHPPKGEEPLEWMLLTDIDVNNFEEAEEKVKWYSLRYRIETFHKILKSGLKVEDCRLETADRLIRYLTVMSVIAWKIFWITLIGRSNPKLSCTKFIGEDWKILYAKFYHTMNFPKKPLDAKEAIHLIARLGGFLDRKSDGEPGAITMWRGLRRLCDLIEGWNIATGGDSCG
ncbi:MAG: IS4 family transposase [Oligoflexia bacterium]|nr:IS4 family transposase [Oligoflexia bacterium]